MSHALYRLGRFAAVAPAVIDAGVGVATLIAFPTTSPQDGATFDTIKRLRAEVLPSVLDQSPARAHVGGQTASWADIGNRVSGRLPQFLAAVILLSFLLLTVVFRSVLVPLKAALLNLLRARRGIDCVIHYASWMRS